MSTLSLVRHGQASFFSDNYDQLSPLGEQQARLLGEYWIRRGMRFDDVYTGPRVRQIETATLVGEAFAKAGLPWPQARLLPELDEHQADRLIKLGISRFSKNHSHIEKLHAAYQAAETPRDKHRTFQLMFEAVVKLWCEDKVGAPGVEPWQAFQERIRAGMGIITESEERGRNVAAFTSVGAITVGLQMSLGCTDRTALDLGWRIKNCSITDFVFSRDRITLEGFNAYPHLEDPSLWTFR
ncbi:MAG: histidine phosphatase family protein [Planctomycetia bacterium]|nr:histidine phosphatase family protein [Planctomycetia bacterium]